MFYTKKSTPRHFRGEWFMKAVFQITCISGNPTQNGFLCRILRQSLGQVASNRISESELFWKNLRENLSLAFMKREHGTFLSMALRPFYHGAYEVLIEGLWLSKQKEFWLLDSTPLDEIWDRPSSSFCLTASLFNLEAPVHFPLSFSANHFYTIGHYLCAPDGSTMEPWIPSAQIQPTY